MSDRPKWVRELHMFIADTIIDDKYEYPDDGSDDWVHGLIEDAANAVMCNVYGHEVVDDQCMIPAHRYCVWCKRREAQL